MATEDKNNRPNGSRNSGTSNNRSSNARMSGSSGSRTGGSSGTRSKGSPERRTSSPSSKDLALDKFGSDIGTAAPGHKKKRKTPQPKSPIKRFAEALFPQGTDSKSEIARKIILLIAIAALIGTLAFLIWQVTGMKQGSQQTLSIAASANVPFESSVMNTPYSQPAYVENPTYEIPTTAGTLEPEYIDLTPVVNTPFNADFASLRARNPDARAWVKVSGTLINNVVMADPDGSQYYIDHNMDKQSSVSGEIFASHLNNLDGTDDNVVLYGHNMKSGYYFAYVNHYVPNGWSKEPLAFYKTHPTIMFQHDGGECEVYKVFAGIVVNTDPQYGEVFDYTSRTQFYSADDFNNYILEVMDRSWFYTDVDLQYGDKLLTLSTCYWPLGRDVPTRFAVLARKVRPGESEEVDTSAAISNVNPKLFDYYYQVSGYSWYGRTWDTSKLLSY